MRTFRYWIFKLPIFRVNEMSQYIFVPKYSLLEYEKGFRILLWWMFKTLPLDHWKCWILTVFLKYTDYRKLYISILKLMIRVWSLFRSMRLISLVFIVRMSKLIRSKKSHNESYIGSISKRGGKSFSFIIWTSL